MPRHFSLQTTKEELMRYMLNIKRNWQRSLKKSVILVAKRLTFLKIQLGPNFPLALCTSAPHSEFWLFFVWLCVVLLFVSSTPLSKDRSLRASKFSPHTAHSWACNVHIYKLAMNVFFRSFLFFFLYQLLDTHCVDSDPFTKTLSIGLFHRSASHDFVSQFSVLN